MKVLITGAAGLVGRVLSSDFKDRYALRLLDIRAVDLEGEWIVGDVRDYDTVSSAMQGMDVVVHLAIARAAHHTKGPPPDDQRAYQIACMDTNVKGTYNVFEAAREHHVERVVYASSARVARGYDWEEDIRITADTPPKPDSVYALTKYFGETMGRYYAERHGLSVVCIRIGTPGPPDSPRLQERRYQRTWVGPLDLIELFRRSVETTDLAFELFHGISDNDQNHWDVSRAERAVGYRPKERYDRDGEKWRSIYEQVGRGRRLRTAKPSQANTPEPRGGTSK